MATPSPPAPPSAVPRPGDSLPELVELLIARLADDGAGVADSEGGASVRVPFTLPGERVRARVWRREANGGGQADLVEVLVPSADRRPAACPLFGVCGGCQLQHLPYDRQLAWKTEVVRASTAPVAPALVVSPCVPSPRELGYRSKITPHHDRIRAGNPSPLPIGFLRVGRRNAVVDVERCPLATDGINAHLPVLRARARAAAPRAKHGVSFLIREAASGVTDDPDARVTERVGALTLDFFAREFFQNNPFLLPALVDFVIDAAASGGAHTLVDTYSGSGLFALAGARRFQRAIGVEVSPGAVAAARENAARNGITNATFTAAQAARIFEGLDATPADTAIIIDPPRKGCDDKFLAQLIAFHPRTIVYVSCNPESLARDLARLLAAGYAARALQPFDMFPQTRHVEAVAVLDASI